MDAQQSSSGPPSTGSPVPSTGSPAANSGNDAFVRLLRDPIRFRLYLLSRIPSAFFSGLRIAAADDTRCVVTVPYKWFTRNPFRSTYFACLSMAAEMSTGVLAMAAIYKRSPAISMLVVGMESSFVKKATTLTTFTCTEAKTIRQAIAQALSTGEAQTIKVRTVGTNASGEMIAEFYITWSFKAKNVK